MVGMGTRGDHLSNPCHDCATRVLRCLGTCTGSPRVEDLEVLLLYKLEGLTNVRGRARVMEQGHGAQHSPVLAPDWASDEAH